MADQPALVAPTAIEEFITAVRDVRLTQLISFVSATIVLYDYIVCIEREVELIWKKRWSVIKLAFLWHRYFGVFCVLFQVYALNSTVVNDEFCTFWFYWETWGYSAILFTSEAVLLLWIYVVYNKNRWILALMGTCYAAEVAGVITILTLSFENFEAKAHGIPGIEYCVMTHIGSPFPLLWVPILAYDALLLLLFLYRGCAGASSNCGWRWAYSYDGLLDMIYRHSLLNFLAIFASYLACAIIWLNYDLGLYQIPVGFALSLSITNCTRLLLNIRRAYYSGVGDPLLFNIRDLPATGANTPVVMLDAPLLPPQSPVSPISNFSHASASTLRDLTATPASTLRVATASPASTLHVTIGHGSSSSSRGRRTPLPFPLRTPSPLAAGTPSERASPRQAGEYLREREVYLSRASMDSDWWQVEMREIRAELGISFAEAV